MRKVISSCLLVAIIFVFAGCSKDPLAEDMIEKIDSIGEVTLEDEELIAELEQTYSEMTDKQKNQVSNYVDLKDARDELDQLIEEEQQEAQEALLEVITNPPYSNAITICSAIKQSLYNPDSLQIYEVEEYLDYYKVDYSGENRLGGTARTSLIAVFTTDGEIMHVYEEKTSDYLEYKNRYFGEDDNTEILDLSYITPYI